MNRFKIQYSHPFHIHLSELLVNLYNERKPFHGYNVPSGSGAKTCRSS
jgi:hypothetical protein